MVGRLGFLKYHKIRLVIAQKVQPDSCTTQYNLLCFIAIGLVALAHLKLQIKGNLILLFLRVVFCRGKRANKKGRFL